VFDGHHILSAVGVEENENAQRNGSPCYAVRHDFLGILCRNVGLIDFCWELF
jgi:hypothetical protein